MAGRKRSAFANDRRAYQYGRCSANGSVPLPRVIYPPAFTGSSFLSGAYQSLNGNVNIANGPMIRPPFYNQYY
jgi:hypothetical protein